MIKFNLIKSSDQIIFVYMLQIRDLRCSRHFWIINNVHLEHILFVIKLDVTSSSKVFNTFDFVFQSILLLT